MSKRIAIMYTQFRSQTYKIHGTKIANPNFLKILLLLATFHCSHCMKQISEEGKPFTLSLKVPSGQIRSAWECYYWIGLEKDINRYRFLIFYFWSWIFQRVQRSEPVHAKRPLILLLVRITVCMCSNRGLFRRTVLQKCGRDINCSLDYGSWVKNSKILAIQTKIEQHFGCFFIK
jgi:hypothetical protein